MTNTSPWANFIEFCAFQNIVLWCLQEKILIQLKFSSKLYCGGLNYALLESVRNLFLVNMSVNRRLKKRAIKCSIRLTLWTVTAQECKIPMVYTSKHRCKPYLMRYQMCAISSVTLKILLKTLSTKYVSKYYIVSFLNGDRYKCCTINWHCWKETPPFSQPNFLFPL